MKCVGGVAGMWLLALASCSPGQAPARVSSGALTDQTPASASAYKTPAPVPKVTDKTRLSIGDLPLCAQTVLSSRMSNDGLRRYTRSNYFLDIRLADQAGRQFGQMTRDMVGQSMAVVLDGEVLLTPYIQEQITGGRLQLSAEPDELQRARQVMNEPCE